MNHNEKSLLDDNTKMLKQTPEQIKHEETLL